MRYLLLFIDAPLDALEPSSLYIIDKKAELLQRWPRDAPYVCMGAL